MFAGRERADRSAPIFRRQFTTECDSDDSMLDDDEDDDFEDALEIARRTRREMMQNRAQFEQQRERREEALFSASEEEEEEEEETKEGDAMVRKNKAKETKAKLKAWAGAYSTFDDVRPKPPWCAHG